MTKVIHVNTPQELDSHMNKGNVVIDFSAEWCFNIFLIFSLFLKLKEVISPAFEKISEEYPDVVFLHVDIDRLSGHKVVATIRSVPTFQFYKNGNKVDEFSGASESQLRSMINRHK
ncbi:hypothetical protein ACTA71_001583 [Dictyostelium dimigraforme]